MNWWVSGLVNWGGGGAGAKDAKGSGVSFADDIERQLYELAVETIRFCRTLPPSQEAREIGGQLRRASTSASANYRAGRRARSTREWIAKIGVVLEELDEADHWLSMLTDSGIGSPPQHLHTGARRLRAILAKSAATARKRYSGRWKPPGSNPPTH